MQCITLPEESAQAITVLVCCYLPLQIGGSYVLDGTI